MKDPGEVKFSKLLRAVAQHLEYGPVGVDNAAVQYHYYPFRGGLDQFAVFFLRFRKEFLRLAAGALYAQALLVDIEQYQGDYAGY